MSALATHTNDPRWIAWRIELRGKEQKPTKVPYGARGKHAEADNAETWLVRADAETLARRIVNGAGGGLGYELGPVAPGLYLCGYDLDSCLHDGVLAAWAQAFLDIAQTYTEVSPSGKGLKGFMYIETGNVRPFLVQIGVADTSWGCRRDVPGEDARDHGPAIEVYCNVRYFTVTEQQWPGAPTTIRCLGADDLARLARLVPGTKATVAGATRTPSADKSRSAIAYRLGRDHRRAGATFEEMCAALRVDSSTAEWMRDKGDKRQLQRIWDKAAVAAGRGLPTVAIAGGKLPQNIDEAETLLIEHDHELFQRGDMVVRPAKEIIAIADQRQALGVRMVPVRATHLVDRLTRIIDFKKYDARSEEWVSVNCPAELAAAYLERIGDWRLPLLRGVIDVPTLRRDGSILDTPGYDAETGILYAPSAAYPRLPRTPSQDEARAALDIICGLLCGFPFVGRDGSDATNKQSPSRSVSLSLALTALIRRSIAHAPLHGFDAPIMGSGKSKLVDLASMIATGHEAPVLSQGKTEEEMEKRLGAALIAGDSLISWDNCEQPLGGELLCQSLTQPTLKIRILGKSQLVSLPTDATFAATGNNLVISGDMVRRTIVSTLDPRMERPELRQFESDPIEVIRADRTTYVIAALTALRGFIVAGMPAQSQVLGSFGEWSALVRDCLIWLGEPDPCLTMEAARAQDPVTLALSEVLEGWSQTIGNGAVSVKRAIEYAAESGNSDFREALVGVAGDREIVSGRHLAKWLARHKGRVINGLRVEMDAMGGHAGVARWRVVRVG